MVTDEQWLNDCEVMLLAAQYGNPPGGWSDPERIRLFQEQLYDIERRMRNMRINIQNAKREKLHQEILALGGVENPEDCSDDLSLYFNSPLGVARCEDCGKTWPCHRSAWGRADHASRCNACKTGTVIWCSE